MALTASNFAYSWSKWNCEASPEKIVMLGAEKLDGTQVTEVKNLWGLSEILWLSHFFCVFFFLLFFSFLFLHFGIDNQKFW